MALPLTYLMNADEINTNIFYNEINITHYIINC